MALAGSGTVIVAAGAAVTLLAVVRLALLGPAPGETGPDAADAADDADGGHGGGSATARVDRIVAGVLLALLGLVLIAVGLLWG